MLQEHIAGVRKTVNIKYSHCDVINNGKSKERVAEFKNVVILNHTSI